ncbi:seipin isoform X2 [Molothrus aeneus]|uniref:seipin isoform X2 n=1 Tax=Molothrus aeneus TaxID=84833 RepID=UPI0034592669
MASGGLPAAPPPPLLSWGAQLGRGARRALLRGALGLSLALLLLWASVFLYGSFYWAYLPAAAVLRPLHLAFRSDCERPGPELCSFPTANVSLLGEHREKLLLYGQLYRVSLELELPESPVNRELGMFMVGLSLYGNGGKSLARSERAAMLHYRSRLLRALHTAAFAGLFLSGFAEQSQTLELELLGRYREDPYSPTVGALVEIRSRRVQLYGARLRVHAHFSGLRYLLYHFPLTSAVVSHTCHTCHTCHTHVTPVTHMSHTCVTHLSPQVPALPLPSDLSRCVTPVTHVSHTCHTPVPVSHTCHTCHTRVTHVSHTCHTPVPVSHTCHTCHTRVTHVSHTCHTPVPSGTCSITSL